MIEARLGQAEPLACYRVISPAYAGTPLSGMGAARRGGRFNRPGQEALYLAMDEATALAEYQLCVYDPQGVLSTPRAGPARLAPPPRGIKLPGKAGST
jgi:RES domain-containing protein